MEETLASKLVLAFNKPKVHCPHCAHEFTPSPVEQLNIHSIGGFEGLLTPKARKVYLNPEYSTVIEITTCDDCGFKLVGKPVPEDELTVVERVSPMNHMRSGGPFLRSVCPNDPEHQTFRREVRLVQFMAAVVRTSAQAEMVYPAGAFDFDLQQCAKDMATIFNDAVEKDLIGHGCLLKLSMVPLATMEMGRSASLAIFVGANVPREKLNEEYGAELFAQEGNIGVGAAAWRIAAKRLEEKK